MSMMWEAADNRRPRRLIIAVGGLGALVLSAVAGAVVASSMQSTGAGATLGEPSPTSAAAIFGESASSVKTSGTFSYHGSYTKDEEYCEADNQVLDVRGDDGSIVGAFPLGPEAYEPGTAAARGEATDSCSYVFAMDLQPSRTYTFTLNGRAIEDATFVSAEVSEVHIFDMTDSSASIRALS